MMGTPDSTTVVQGPAWYVVHIRNQHEAKVESGLRAHGMEVFVPRITVRSRRKDRFKFLAAPLFSCYVFVYARMSPAAYNAIIRQNGVAGVVGGKGYCTPAPADTVTAIRSITEAASPVIIGPGWWQDAGFRWLPAPWPVPQAPFAKNQGNAIWWQGLNS